MGSESARKLIASAIIWPDKIVDRLRARPDVVGSIIDPTLHSLAVACCSDQAERHEGAASIAWLLTHAKKAGCTVQADYIAELSDAVDLCPTASELEALFAVLLSAEGGDLDSGFDHHDPRWEAPPITDDDAPRHAAQGVPDACGPPAMGGHEGDEAWRNQLIMVKSESGERLRACAQNALIFARNHPAIAGRVRLDVWAQQLVWMSAPPWASATRDARDEDADEMALWLAQTEALVVSRDACWHALRAVAVEHPLDRLRDWLDPIVWDGKARLESLFIDHAGAEDSEYTRAVTRAWCVSAVARVYQPGCQADHMLVLEGSQGVGKTSILRALAGDKWHAEITLAATKDSIMDLHGPWVIEWSELSGLARSEVEQVKALISRRVDRIRLPYARTTVNLPRRCVMAGTTNTDDWATDQSGNRRYWPVPVGECDVSSIAAVRDQVWAEAREAYHAGSQWWLDAEATGLALEAQAERLPADPWIDVLNVALNGRFAEKDWVSTSDLYDALGIIHQAQTSGMSRRLAIQMKLLGWTSAKKRNTGNQVRGWTRPRKQPASA